MEVMDKYLIVVKKGFDPKHLRKLDIKIVNSYKNFPNILEIEATEDAYESLLDNPYIEEVEKDDEDEFDEIESFQEESYAIDILKAREYWDKRITGKGVKIAVFDSGCQHHEDLNIAGGYNAYEDSKDYMKDFKGHGTHVAGIINMQDNDKGY